MDTVSLFESTVTRLVERGEELAAELARLPLADQVAALNGIRRALHEAGPFREQPVDLVVWVPNGSVQANGYNPNTVAAPEMRLLAESIRASGYTQPIVSFPDPQADRERTVVDGFHRLRVAREDRAVRRQLHGYLPVTEIRSGRHGVGDRMTATIQHNRARGRHGVTPMTAIVSELVQRGWDDKRIARELGMDADELLRMKQVTGLASLFAGAEFSEAWDGDGEAEPGPPPAMSEAGALPGPRFQWEDRTERRSVLENEAREMLARVQKSPSRPGWNWTVYGPPMTKGHAPTKEEAQCQAELKLLSS